MNDAAHSALWRVSGTVQGVGFRWYVSKNARAMGVDGWVRNLESGEVLVHACAALKKLETLRALILEGPPGSRVEGIQDVQEQPEMPASSPFSIIR